MFEYLNKIRAISGKDGGFTETSISVALTIFTFNFTLMSVYLIKFEYFSLSFIDAYFVFNFSLTIFILLIGSVLFLRMAEIKFITERDIEDYKSQIRSNKSLREKYPEEIENKSGHILEYIFSDIGKIVISIFIFHILYLGVKFGVSSMLMSVFVSLMTNIVLRFSYLATMVFKKEIKGMRDFFKFDQRVVPFAIFIFAAFAGNYKYHSNIERNIIITTFSDGTEVEGSLIAKTSDSIIVLIEINNRNKNDGKDVPLIVSRHTSVVFPVNQILKIISLDRNG